VVGGFSPTAMPAIRKAQNRWSERWLQRSSFNRNPLKSITGNHLSTLKE
jgi:hypothetical protein